MKLSRMKRPLSVSTHPIEPLESRCLLSATLSTQIATQSLTAGQTLPAINLGSFFNDPLVTGTAVVLQTPEGNIPLVLTDSQTPATVGNFKQYITSGEYADTIFNNSQPGSVLEGGGYDLSGAHISTFGNVISETGLSNTTGTITMALPSGPGTATSDWFINLANNASLLDGNSDGGPFTAFGKVVYNGMSVVNTIQNLPIEDDTGIANNAGTSLPVLSGTTGTTTSGEPANNLVTINPAILPGGLSYSAVSSNTGEVTARVDSSGHLTLTAVGGVGSASITVTATDMGGGTVHETFTANVSPAVSVITATGVAGVRAIRGSAVTATVATFTDTNTAGSYVATVNWGDGTTSTGTVAGAGAAGKFAVTGTHTYASAATYATTITITPGLGSTATVTGSVSARKPILGSAITATGATGFRATRGVAAVVPVATFTDTFTSNTASNYTVAISWGDGTTSTGTVVGNSVAGSFKVTGTHTYNSAATYLTATTITPAVGVAATVTGTVLVRKPSTTPTIIAKGTSGTRVTRGLLATPLVATFVDSILTTPATSYTAVINWGDGTTSSGTVATNGGAGTGKFEVLGTHTYITAATYDTQITIAAPAESAITATGSIVARRPG